MMKKDIIVNGEMVDVMQSLQNFQDLNIDELVKIYSAADVFINPTVVDNYPTTNIEASCCGTPVITYRTGGSPESVPKSQVVEKNNVKHVKELIKNGNLKVIQRKDFDKSSMKEAYLNLYNSL